jgi:hypothetical protein
MINRTLVSFVAALFVLSISTSFEASARAGGGARGGGFHGGGHRFAARPVARIAPLHRHFGAHHAAHRRFGFHHRHGIGRHHRNGLNNDAAAAVIFYGSVGDWGNGITDWGNGNTPDAPVVGALGSNAPAEPVSTFAAAGVMCRSTVQTVPRERGGVAQVRVTRCYPPAE